jgi:MerT mercuric transport protein
MSHIAQPSTPPTVVPRRQASLLSLVGLAAAPAALVGASCCALLLVLASLGLAGAWIANLGIFVSYRSYVTVAAVVVIAMGWGVTSDAGRRGVPLWCSLARA